MAGEPVVHATDSDFDSIIKGATTPVLVDFYTTWCGPCKAIAPHVEALATTYAGKLTVVKVNVEQAMETGSKFNVISVPTLLMFKGGMPIDQMIGAAAPAKLQAWVEKHL